MFRLGEAAMSAEKDVVLKYVEAFNRGDVDEVVAQFAPDAQVWGVLGYGTPEQARAIWQDLVDCLEMKLRVDGIVQEGSVVAVRYTESGRSAKAFRGMGPTGKTYELTAMEWFEVEGGKIQKRWGARDSGTMFRQLGIST
jgi:steroid delta-isomerase-like uncharacterized protein